MIRLEKYIYFSKLPFPLKINLNCKMWLAYALLYWCFNIVVDVYRSLFYSQPLSKRPQLTTYARLNYMIFVFILSSLYSLRFLCCYFQFIRGDGGLAAEIWHYS